MIINNLSFQKFLDDNIKRALYPMSKSHSSYRNGVRHATKNENFNF